MGMNTIRLEGRLDRDEFFEKTDQLGILVMPGGRAATPGEVGSLARRSEQNCGRHLCVTKSPAAESSERLCMVERQRQSAAGGRRKNVSEHRERDAVAKSYRLIRFGTEGSCERRFRRKNDGPYEYVPPVYWLADTQAGGAYGYNTETSPGPAIPLRESLEELHPQDHLWPIDDVWNYHAGGERFTTVNVFTEGLNADMGRRPHWMITSARPRQ